MLDKLHIDHIRATWSIASTDAAGFTADFYTRLFAAAPEVEPMFTASSMSEQRRKLAAAVSAVVTAADDLDRIAPALAAMGRRHGGYGVEPYQYAVVGQALIDTLADRVGADFDQHAREAWALAIGRVAAIMISAAVEATTEPSPAHA